MTGPGPNRVRHRDGAGCTSGSATVDPDDEDLNLRASQRRFDMRTDVARPSCPLIRPGATPFGAAALPAPRSPRYAFSRRRAVLVALVLVLLGRVHQHRGRRRHRPAGHSDPFSSPAGGSDADNDVDAFDPCSPFASKLWLLKAAVVDSQLAPAGRAAAGRLPVAWLGTTASVAVEQGRSLRDISMATRSGARRCGTGRGPVTPFLAAGPARPDTGARLRRDRAPRGSAHGPRRRPRVRVRVDPRQRQIIRPRPCTRVHQVAASAEAVGRGQPLRALPLARTVSTIAEYRRGWTGSRV